VTPALSRRTAAYTERLGVSWWSWPAAAVAGGILGAEVGVSLTSLPIWAPFAITFALTAAFMVWLSRIRITVTDTELQVDDARLPRTVIADVIALDAAGKREVLGVGAHPMAFVIQRPWIGGAVQVMLDDPADPTPYWVVSTRHPVELATVLLAGGTSAANAPS
jgi:Protein of unknown function (DUF3093)